MSTNPKGLVINGSYWTWRRQGRLTQHQELKYWAQSLRWTWNGEKNQPSFWPKCSILMNWAFFFAHFANQVAISVIEVCYLGCQVCCVANYCSRTLSQHLPEQPGSSDGTGFRAFLYGHVLYAGQHCPPALPKKGTIVNIGNGPAETNSCQLKIEFCPPTFHRASWRDSTQPLWDILHRGSSKGGSASADSRLNSPRPHSYGWQERQRRGQRKGWSPKYCACSDSSSSSLRLSAQKRWREREPCRRTSLGSSSTESKTFRTHLQQSCRNACDAARQSLCVVCRCVASTTCWRWPRARLWGSPAPSMQNWNV